MPYRVKRIHHNPPPVATEVFCLYCGGLIKPGDLALIENGRWICDRCHLSRDLIEEDDDDRD